MLYALLSSIGLHGEESVLETLSSDGWGEVLSRAAVMKVTFAM